MNGYRELKVWQLGVEISLAIYEATQRFPQSELYALSSQLRRAAVSIPSNIAEGNARGQTKDFIRFLSIARGSLAEVETQLLIAERLGYLKESEIKRLTDMLDEESRMLAGLKRALTQKLRN